jgi:cytochrome c551/c552
MRKLLSILMLVSMPAFAGYSARYLPPQTLEEAPIANQLRERQILEKLSSALNRFVKMSANVPVVGRSCGQANAFYSPSTREISVCYEFLIDQNAKLSRKYSQNTSPTRLSEILTAELTFVVLHEAGHSLIDIYRLPVLGKNEDAADAMASFMLLAGNGDKMLYDAIYFMQPAKVNLATKILHGAAVYGDEHALSEQRMANVICWGFGKNPNGFSEAAARIRLPQQRINRCADEYTKLERDVRGLLGENLALNRPSEPSPSLQNNSGTAPAPESTLESSNTESAKLEEFRCNACHDLSLRKIGPSYREIARRYQGREVSQKLAAAVRNGSVGNWGQVPAPPQPNIQGYEALLLARWILQQ